MITTPFGFDSTVAEVAAGIDLTGKRAIVTGAASGIGPLDGGVGFYALDPTNAERLRELSERALS